MYSLAIVFINPTLSPDGGSDMIIDVTEGTNLTLSCRELRITIVVWHLINVYLVNKYNDIFCCLFM